MANVLLLVLVGLGLLQSGLAGTLNLGCSQFVNFSTTGGNFVCQYGNASATISNGFAKVWADSTIPEPPPNFGESTEPSSANWKSTLLLDFTNGPTCLPGGCFLPCLSLLSDLPGPSFESESAAFASVVISQGTFPPALSTCTGGPSDFSATNDIPYAFGVTQAFALELSAAVGGGRFGGNGSASFTSFEVFDSAGNNITSQVSYTLIDSDVPEPRPLSLLMGGIAICYGATRRWKA